MSLPLINSIWRSCFMNIIIFGYGYEGVKLYRELEDSNKYNVIGFADNSLYKQGNRVGSNIIMSMDELIQLKETVDYSVLIDAKKWYEIGQQLENYDIPIEGIYQNGSIETYDRMSFERLDLTKKIVLYAGDIYDEIHMSDENLYGLSISKADSKHILHDIRIKYPLPDNCIFSYQAEDVLEHIEQERLVMVIDEIYRILKKRGLFRICLPDYFSPYLKNTAMKDEHGNIIFDPTGGGDWGSKGVINGGHLWFPNYITVKRLLEKTKFRNINFLCYHTEEGILMKKEIDYLKGYVIRVPEQECKNPVYSMVVDCYK